MYFSGNNIQNHISQARLALLGSLTGKNRRPLSIIRKEEHPLVSAGLRWPTTAITATYIGVCFVFEGCGSGKKKTQNIRPQNDFPGYYSIIQRPKCIITSSVALLNQTVWSPVSRSQVEVAMLKSYRARDSSARERNAVL